MKQNDSQGHVLPKTFLCMMAILFFAGIFFVGAGVNMAWHQRVAQTSRQQVQSRQDQYEMQMRAVRKKRFSGWKTWRHRRHHREFREDNCLYSSCP